MTRICKQCGEEKDIDCFQEKVFYNTTSVGKVKCTTRRWKCIKCMNILTASWVDRNRKRFNKNILRWHIIQRVNLTPFYIKKTLKRSGHLNITPELIKLKKQLYEIKRQVNQKQC